MSKSVREKIKVIITIHVVPEKSNIAKEFLSKFEAAKEVYEVTGDYDFFAIAEFDSLSELSKTIEEMRSQQWILKTTTSIILTVVRGETNS